MFGIKELANYTFKKSSDGLKTLNETKYIKQLEKRAEIEQYTLGKLPYKQGIKYKSILDTIEYNFDILENNHSSSKSKATARGKIKALCKIRNEMEKPYLPKSMFSKQTSKTKHSKSESSNKSQNQRVENKNIFDEFGLLFSSKEDADKYR